jgi:hypothetical protein
LGTKKIERFTSMRLPEATSFINAIRPKGLVSLIQWPLTVNAAGLFARQLRHGF